MTDYRPTRMCPHRLCRPTHIGLGILGIVFIAQLMLTSLLTIVFMGILSVISFAVARLIHQKSLHDQVLEDAVDRTADRVLLVRTGWANTAVTLDALFLVVAAVVVSELFTGGGKATMPTPANTGILTIAACIGISALSEFAHRQATRPVKPKRVLAPAGS